MKIDHLWKIDLNLLVILDVLLKERSVTRAAEQLHLTPSAVSHALKRLRELFDDELLVRDGRRMAPTVRARALSETLPRALGQLAQTLAAPEPFLPATSTRTFRLAAPDFIAPVVLQEIGNAAPQVRVEWMPPSPTAVRELSQGQCDALIGPTMIKNEGLRGQMLGEWPWMVFGRKGHPAFSQWSLEAWAAYSHLQVGTSVIGGQGPVEQRLSELGVERQVGAVVPYFAMAAPTVAQTDLLITVPSVSMSYAQRVYGLERREVPFDLPSVKLALFRSATAGEEQGARWFLEQIKSACEGLE